MPGQKHTCLRQAQLQLAGACSAGVCNMQTEKVWQVHNLQLAGGTAVQTRASQGSSVPNHAGLDRAPQV